MINTFIVEGKIGSIGELKTTENDIKFLKLSIDSERNYRNYEGIYETDTIEIELWRGLAEIVFENAKVDDFISVQGRIQSSHLKTKDKKEYIVYKFVAEKVSFLS